MPFQRTAIWKIPIPDEVYERFPQEVKTAWETFNDWWQDVLALGNPVSHKDMLENVAKAYEIMKAAPIPGYDDATGKDSCYVHGVEMRLLD